MRFRAIQCQKPIIIDQQYAATGHQPGGRVNYVAVGSSSKMNLGDDYYAQNFYDIHLEDMFTERKIPNI